MAKVLYSRSTLTDRYQTTIPEPIREALHLGKRDKIEYILGDDGKVIITRVADDDPVITDFLTFLANDIKLHPKHINSFDPVLVNRAQSLISDIEIDLDKPLSDKDE